MEEKEYLDEYEKRLTNELMKLCRSFGMLDDHLLETEDIDQRWKEYAPEYIMEALKEFNSYPEVAIAWAGYLGMAVAEYWDTAWAAHHNDSYASFHGTRGFDDMDDHIMQDILHHPLDSAEAKQITLMLQTCAQQCITYMRHQQIERQTAKAFHIFARTTRAMFKIGASLQLRLKGYRIQKLDLNELQNKRYS